MENDGADDSEFHANRQASGRAFARFGQGRLVGLPEIDWLPRRCDAYTSDRLCEPLERRLGENQSRAESSRSPKIIRLASVHGIGLTFP